MIVHGGELGRGVVLDEIDSCMTMAFQNLRDIHFTLMNNSG